MIKRELDKSKLSKSLYILPFLALIVLGCKLESTKGQDTATAKEVVNVSYVQEGNILSLKGAEAVIKAAQAEAHKRKVSVVIAVADTGGHLVLLDRMDYTVVVSAKIAAGKARTAAMFRFPTGKLEKAIGKGRTTMLTIGDAITDFTPLRGGVPIFYNGKIAGAIGVSGVDPVTDEEIALIGAKALTK